MAPASRDPNQPASNYGLAFRVDPVTGELTPHGPQVTLPSRPIYMSLDRSNRFMITCYPGPANITVHRINEDGTLGDQVPQPGDLDYGNYPHCIRASVSNKTVVMVTRGNNPTQNRPENPGAIKVFGFNEGRLSNIASLTNGHGFGPRHMDFDPKDRFAYFCLERNNRLDVYGVKPDSTLTTEALFKRSTLRDPNDTHISGQGPGAIHAHPNGRIVYVSNRSELATERNGRKVWVGGENNIAVFSINQKTGEPTLIQTVNTNSVEPRTFTMDPSMKILVAASQEAMPMLTQDDEGATFSLLSAGLSVFRIAEDGRLTFVRKVDVDTPCCKEGQGPQTQGIQFWCGTLAVA
jgi:6-phosphogluconolactonase (cycloisomerase 2 family)